MLSSCKSLLEYARLQCCCLPLAQPLPALRPLIQAPQGTGHQVICPDAGQHLIVPCVTSAVPHRASWSEFCLPKVSLCCLQLGGFMVGVGLSQPTSFLSRWVLATGPVSSAWAGWLPHMLCELGGVWEHADHQARGMPEGLGLSVS